MSADDARLASETLKNALLKGHLSSGSLLTSESVRHGHVDVP